MFLGQLWTFADFPKVFPWFSQDGHVQATAAGVCGGAVALGATGGATGLTAGVVVGAALGVVPAIFTFGLSIPLGAVIGGGFDWISLMFFF